MAILDYKGGGRCTMKNEKMKKGLKITGRVLYRILLVLLVFFGLLFVETGDWALTTFGDIPFEQIIFHIFVPLDGSNTDIVGTYIQECLPFPLMIALVLAVLFFIQDRFSSKLEKSKAIAMNIILISCCAITFVLGFHTAALSVNADEYIDNMLHPSTIYEDYYVDPSTVNYTFPETKRNLIYIFLESMETTYEDTTNGGAMDYNLIPELTNLANENLTFTNGDLNNNGFRAMTGNSWTVAAMVGQTAGVPLNLPIDDYQNGLLSEENFLGGAYSIGEILENNGYSNTLLLGSDAKFGGRKYYFEQHGNYNIIDLYEVKDRGWLNEDYYVWWGYEDAKLFEYAQMELTNLSASDQPFNFTMLTADTHFTNGHYCQLCYNQWGDQYSNVLSCSSRQVADFIAWCQTQSWYENTTIVIAGDHKSMDATWFQSIEDSGYERKDYYTIINSATSPTRSDSRVIATVDLYPTTLASLGVTFDSNRLGLGTNLFSDESTLSEVMGFDEFDSEVQKHSNYYDKNILYGIGAKDDDE